MLYKMPQTRILDSRYKIGANLQTELSKNYENDKNSIIKKYNELGELPSSIIIRSDADESHLRELDIKK